MQHSETRLIAAWAKVEYADIDDVNSLGVDNLPDLTDAEYNALMGIKARPKKTRYHDIEATLSFLTGHEIDVETHTVFGTRNEKEFVMRPLRSVEEHEACVKAMEQRGYAFDPNGGNNISINEPDMYSPRQLAPVAQMIFGLINEMENKKSIHKRERCEY